MPASAGAWIAPEGGQEIWTNTVGERNEGVLYESSLYWEVPLGDRTSVVTAPWVEQAYDIEDGWRGEATLGAKRVLIREEDWVVAAQAGALWVSHPGEACDEGGAELRLLSGLSRGRSFVNLELAERALSGGCGGERVDLTAGYRPNDNWLAMGQVFVDYPRDGEETLKLQFSLVRFGNSGRGIQFGVRGRIDGGEPEPALVLGLWGRPGR